MNGKQKSSVRPFPLCEVGQRLSCRSAAASLRTLRRRWLQVAGVGLLSAASAVSGALAQPPEPGGPAPESTGSRAGGSVLGKVIKSALGRNPKYTATALLRVAAKEPHIAFQTAQRDSPDNFEIYKRTQEQLLKSPFVLTAALRKPGTAGLSMVKQQDEPVVWLARQLRVEFPGDAEIMTVSLTGSDPREVTRLVNAVVDAYIKEVVDMERTARTRRQDELERIYSGKSIEVRAKRTKLVQLSGILGTTADEVLSLRQQMALQELAEYGKQALRTELALMRARVELTARQAMLGSVDREEISDLEVDAYVQSDPVARQVLNELHREMTRLRKQLPVPPIRETLPDIPLEPLLPAIPPDPESPQSLLPGLSTEPDSTRPLLPDLSPGPESAQPRLPGLSPGGELSAPGLPGIGAEPEPAEPPREPPLAPSSFPPLEPPPEFPSPPPLERPPESPDRLAPRTAADPKSAEAAPRVPVPAVPPANVRNVKELWRDLKAVEQEFIDRREELRAEIRCMRRAALKTEFKRLEVEVVVLSEQHQLLEERLKRQEKEAEEMCVRPVAFEMAHAELDNLQVVLAKIAEQREKLRVELRAAPRIQLIQPAEVPESPD